MTLRGEMVFKWAGILLIAALILFALDVWYGLANSTDL